MSVGASISSIGTTRVSNCHRWRTLISLPSLPFSNTRMSRVSPLASAPSASPRVHLRQRIRWSWMPQSPSTLGSLSALVNPARSTKPHATIMRNIIDHFKGNRDFPRLRIGIGRPPGKMNPINFVLRPFNKQEREELNFTFQHGLEAVRILLLEGFNNSATFANSVKTLEQLG